MSRRGRSLPRPFLAVPNVTAHPSTASVPITVLLYYGICCCVVLVWPLRVNGSRGGGWRGDDSGDYGTARHPVSGGLFTDTGYRVWCLRDPQLLFLPYPPLPHTGSENDTDTLMRSHEATLRKYRRRRRSTGLFLPAPRGPITFRSFARLSRHVRHRRD